MRLGNTQSCSPEYGVDRALVARENENRWMELSPEASADGERMAQWASVAKLRRIEVERIEALLREMGASIQQKAAGFEP